MGKILLPECENRCIVQEGFNFYMAEKGNTAVPRSPRLSDSAERGRLSSDHFASHGLTSRLKALARLAVAGVVMITSLPACEQAMEDPSAETSSPSTDSGGTDTGEGEKPPKFEIKFPRVDKSGIKFSVDFDTELYPELNITISLLDGDNQVLKEGYFTIRPGDGEVSMPFPQPVPDGAVVKVSDSVGAYSMPVEDKGDLPAIPSAP